MVQITFATLCGIRGIVGTFLPQLAPNTTLTPMALGVGVVLGVLGFRMLAAPTPSSTPRRSAAVQQGGIVIAAAVTVLALLWSMSNYATAAAEANATATQTNLWDRKTVVVVDTSERLIVPPDLIKETPVPPVDPALGPTFLYECFRALDVLGDRWILVPAKWTQSRGYAVIVTASASKSISTQRLEGISAAARTNRSGSWQCPEVAPDR